MSEHLSPITLKNQLACVTRELSKRKGIYPKLVASGRLKPQVADYEIKAMTAVQVSIKKLVDLEEVSEEIKAESRLKAEKQAQEHATNQPATD